MRVQVVQSARKDQGHCESCGEAITAGQSYKYIKPRYGGKRKRHASCPTWRPSEMTSSKIASAYAAQESAHDALDAIDATEFVTVDDVRNALEEILRDAASAAEECAGEYQEGIDNLPEAFQETSSSAEIAREKIDALETWQQELEGFDMPEPDDDVANYNFEEHADDDPDTRAEAMTAWSEWVEEAVQAARDAVDSLEA